MKAHLNGLIDNNMDLNLHIGLPKTGTTTIQEHFLAGASGYLGMHSQGKCLVSDKKVLKRFRDIATRHHFLARNEVQHGVEKWVQLVTSLAEKKGHFPSLGLSMEGMSRWYLYDQSETRWPVHEAGAVIKGFKRTRPLPVAEFIDLYLLPAWREKGQVRVLLTLRNQADWLASLYAELSHGIAGAGQHDFETQVASILEKSDPAIDWWGYIQDLQSVVGNDNVKVLLFEDMGKAFFWRELAYFMGIQDVAAEKMLAGASPRENVRGSGLPGTWAVRSEMKFCRHWLNSCWPDDLLPGMKKSLVSVVARLEPKLTFFPARWLRRGETIEVTPALRRLVSDHCAESNRALGLWLSRNLQELGY